ncbi:MAG: two-component system, cell cycle response regulator DivK [Acidobacteriota bacterium]|jgi:CheY-like chemotaxis protein|nr:two-component system, cell cycle response regulator DivK [Acidobacteriota bacterium]MDT5261734.1 two-component system, cell cycle response regulator DivK [Acidobacteriota bacterium]MDT7781187.1 two-component system, cell cycle response regulator DivK [Acidobacteriota bacterium]
MDSEAKSTPVVMLVEDFQDTREMMRRMLELKGCRVVEAANGQEAITLSQQGGLDLVLMDLNMPVLDGFNATLRIREYEQTRDVPVVAVTAYDSVESRAAAVAVGCCDYVIKPLDLEHLSALLRRLLPQRDSARLDGAA